MFAVPSPSSCCSTSILLALHQPMLRSSCSSAWLLLLLLPVNADVWCCQELTVSTLGFSAIFHTHASLSAASNGPTLPIQRSWSEVKVPCSPQSISKNSICDDHVQQPTYDPLLRTCPCRRFGFKCGGGRRRWWQIRGPCRWWHAAD
jgi:hypothetical protein